MSASTKKSAAPTTAKAPAKAPTKKAQAAVPATKTQAKVPAKKVPAKVPDVKAPAAKKTSREAMLARVEAVRMGQRAEGHFDCFGRASDGYCDQGACTFHTECLSVSRLLHSL